MFSAQILDTFVKIWSVFTNTFRPCHLDLSKTPTPPHHQARPQKIITNPKNLLPKTLSPTKPCPKETDPISKYPQSCLRLSSIKNHSVAKSKLEKKTKKKKKQKSAQTFPKWGEKLSLATKLLYKSLLHFPFSCAQVDAQFMIIP